MALESDGCGSETAVLEDVDAEVIAFRLRVTQLNHIFQGFPFQATMYRWGTDFYGAMPTRLP